MDKAQHVIMYFECFVDLAGETSFNLVTLKKGRPVIPEGGNIEQIAYYAFLGISNADSIMFNSLLCPPTGSLRRPITEVDKSIFYQVQIHHNTYYMIDLSLTRFSSRNAEKWCNIYNTVEHCNL